MAARTYIYFDTDGNALESVYVQTRSGAARFAASVGLSNDGRFFKGMGVAFGRHNGEWKHVTRLVAYKNRNPSLHKCSARCQNATGPNCECACGGKNHGAGS